MFAGCVEPFDVLPGISEANNLEGLLIVEANISNVEKRQQVLLSRLRAVESDSTVNVAEDRLFNATSAFVIQNGLAPDFETGATVLVMDNQGRTFAFEESEPGTYESTVPFAAQANTSYQVTITTSDGMEYQSDEKELPQEAVLDRVYAERTINSNGVEGVSIRTDASFPNMSGRLLRYSFEETYKIIAPNWTAFEFETIRDQQDTDQFGNILYPDVQLVPRTREERVCYNTDFSTSEVLVNGGMVAGNTIQGNQIRFIGRNNPIISHRYSILVRQFSVSAESFEFYETLSAFSQNESVFSQIQPGRVEGNVSNVNGDNEVIGYFDVSSEVSQRFYFNYEDFFPGEPLPPYFGTVSCDRLISPILENPERDGPYPPPPFACPEGLISQWEKGLIEFFDVNGGPDLCEGPYFVTFTICGDCNVVGSNIVPEFWTEG